MNNYTIDAFYKQLIKDINECGLPIGVAYFVLKDCLNQINNGYRIAIDEENPKNVADTEETVSVTKDDLEKIDATEGEIEIVK